ncbi:MAG TPA: O-antigen ligase family protein [Vicinamibacteria bacterium]|nr:O-antigen ligase family protein [Vicinamibacteria bacterium]
MALRPTPPLVFVTLFAAAHVASALLAPAHAAEALRFSLRMAAMAAFAWTVAAAPARARGAGLVALATAAGLVALLLVAEGVGVRGLDPFLNRFRESPFNVGGVRRATATTEYPNAAAAFLVYGIAAASGLVSRLARPLLAVVPSMLLLSLGLLYTYSRGALLAAGVGLLTSWAALRRHDLTSSRQPLAALAILTATTIAFSAGGEVFRLRLVAEGWGTYYQAAYRAAENPLRLRPGETRTTAVELTNTGTKTWSAAEAFHLSHHWRRADGNMLRFEGDRTTLTRDLPPGESLIVQARVVAPSQEGRYALDWDMVHEHTTWFSEQGVPVARVAAIVEGVAAPPLEAKAQPGRLVPPDAQWRPGRAELWSLALAMWGQRPLLGVGSDNFRRLYGPVAGKKTWDARVYANNTLIEVAATTGLVGLAAFVALLAACARAGWQHLQGASEPWDRAVGAALLAAFAAIVAHGVLDYFLAFTGHYLVFGFIAGALGTRAQAR